MCHDLASMHSIRGAAALSGDSSFIVAIGGLNGLHFLKSAELYSFRSLKWKALPRLAD